MKFSHKRHELVVDILKNFRLFFECFYEAVLEVDDLLWHSEPDNILEASQELGFA